MSNFRAMPGKAVVRLFAEVRQSVILTVNPIEEATRGEVLSGGDELGLVPGDKVIVRHRAGKRTSGWDGTEDEIVFYGAAGGRPFDGFWLGKSNVWPMLVPLDEVILAKVEDDVVAPLGSNVMVKVEPRPEATESGVYLLAKHQAIDPVCEVVAVGDGVTVPVRVGDKVVIHEGAVDTRGVGLKDHAILGQEFILAVVS